MLQVIATESEGGNGSAIVRVNVENVNDVTPFFQPVNYNGSIREEASSDAFIALVGCGKTFNTHNVKQIIR